MWLLKQQIYKSSPVILPYSYTVYSGSTLGTHATCYAYSATPVTLYSHSAAMEIGSILYTSPGGIQAPYNGGGYDHFFQVEGILVRIDNLGVVTAISTCGISTEHNLKISFHSAVNTSLKVEVFVNGVPAFLNTVSDNYLDLYLSIPVGALVTVRSTAINNIPIYVTVYSELIVTDNAVTTLYDVRQAGTSPLTIESTDFVMPDSGGVEIYAFSEVSWYKQISTNK